MGDMDGDGYSVDMTEGGDILLLHHQEHDTDSSATLELSTTSLHPQEHDTDSSAPPELPTGKDYHLFFSYESTDRLWVESCLETLEGAPYHFRCCYDTRDFLGSMDVLGNIGSLMETSLTVLFLLSPEHTDSTYCDFEANIAFQLKREKQLRIIPVLVRGEENVVPLSFRFINYIDARDGVDSARVLEKIVRAIRQGPDIGNPTTCQPKEINGNVVTIANKPELGRGFPRRRNVFEKITDQHMYRCRDMGSEVPRSVLEQTRALLNDTLLLRAGHVTLPRPAIAVIILAVSILGGSLPLLLASTVLKILNMDDREAWVIMASVVAVSVSVALAAGVSAGCGVRKLNNRMLEKCFDRAAVISQRLYRPYNTLVIVNTSGGSSGLALQVVKYNVADCQDFIAAMLRKDDHYTTASGEEIQQAAKRIISDAIPGYSQVLSKRELKVSSIRHKVYDDVMCLCQHVEKYKLHEIGTADDTLISSERSLRDSPAIDSFV